MDKQDVLKQLPLIYFERKSANHLTYIKSFSGNKWLPDKGYAVKVNTKTIGKINNADGNGLILFTADFLNAHPVFKDYGVKRIVTVDKGSGKRIWHLEVVYSAKHLQELPPTDSREVLNCISISQNLIFNRLLARAPLLTTLEGCFPDKCGQTASSGLLLY